MSDNRASIIDRSSRSLTVLYKDVDTSTTGDAFEPVSVSDIAPDKASIQVINRSQVADATFTNAGSGVVIQLQHSNWPDLFVDTSSAEAQGQEFEADISIPVARLFRCRVSNTVASTVADVILHLARTT